MKVYSLLFLFTLFLGSHCFSEEEKTGFFRNLIKRRMASRPAPEANSDTGKKIESPGDYTFSLPFSGMDRYYKLHVPPSYRASKALPLLVALHGGAGDMVIMSTAEFYKLNPKADKEGFVVVYPNGYSQFKSGKFATWNAGNCCAKARDKKIDDVGFIEEVIKKVSSQLAIDKEKIFATGMSNGAMMAYRLACEKPELFKAIAAVAGTDNTQACAPKVPVSVLHIHAKDDDHVLFTGGSGKSFGDKSTVTDYVSVADSIAKWVKLNSCINPAKKVLQAKNVVCELYSGCKNNSRIELCVTDDGGHSWPGGKKPRGGKGSTAISAEDTMWDFFNL